MTILLLAEINESGLVLDATASTVAAASALGDVTLLCAGSNIGPAAEEAAKIDGVTNVIMADNPALAHGMAEATTDLILSLADNITHILAPATSNGKSILPRVAALLDAMIISDVIEITSADTFKRPIYAGNAIQTVQSNDPIKVLTIRTSAFSAAPTNNTATSASAELPTFSTLSTWVEDKVAASKGPELSSADIVVSAGRAIGSVENFSIISTLADKLGAAVGASRAAVDAGYAPNDWQVGQTGKIIAPSLYLACGISGAIQHLAGMKDSKVIVAINTDPDAPIFQIADYGLEADLFDAIPKLTEQL